MLSINPTIRRDYIECAKPQVGIVANAIHRNILLFEPDIDMDQINLHLT